MAESIDRAEIEKFNALAAEWWDPKGPAAPLHAQTPARMRFLRDCLAPLAAGSRDAQPLAGLKVLDLGCGPGLASEPMARMGAAVTGIDASAAAIAAAREHARDQGLTIAYRQTAAEALRAEGAVFDAVVCLEVIEHVADPADFLDDVAALLRPGGRAVFSTLNRSAKSYAMAIVGAEYLLRLLPRGTHEWRRFLKPSELAGGLRERGLDLLEAKGIVLNPLDRGWRLSDRDLDVNYILAAEKRG